MGHYAKVLNKKVVNVIVAESDFFDDFIDNSPGKYIQTSYNTRGGVHYDPATGEPSVDQSKALRKNFATKGFTYDEARDAFIPPKPFDSWTLNETTCLWDSPLTYPTVLDDGADPVVYTWWITWNETKHQADNTKGWEAYKKNKDGTDNSDTTIYDWNGSSWTS